MIEETDRTEALLNFLASIDFTDEEIRYIYEWFKELFDNIQEVE
jgi:hypothetical protein